MNLAGLVPVRSKEIVRNGLNEPSSRGRKKPPNAWVVYLDQHLRNAFPTPLRTALPALACRQILMDRCQTAMEPELHVPDAALELMAACSQVL